MFWLPECHAQSDVFQNGLPWLLVHRSILENKKKVGGFDWKLGTKNLDVNTVSGNIEMKSKTCVFLLVYFYLLLSSFWQMNAIQNLTLFQFCCCVIFCVCVCVCINAPTFPLQIPSPFWTFYLLALCQLNFQFFF